MFTDSKKDSLIQLRVNKRQKEIIKKLADKKCMTITGYIFSLLEIEYEKEMLKK